LTNQSSGIYESKALIFVELKLQFIQKAQKIQLYIPALGMMDGEMFTADHQMEEFVVY
jgi:hypothetical protein